MIGPPYDSSGSGPTYNYYYETTFQMDGRHSVPSEVDPNSSNGMKLPYGWGYSNFGTFNNQISDSDGTQAWLRNYTDADLTMTNNHPRHASNNTSSSSISSRNNNDHILGYTTGYSPQWGTIKAALGTYWSGRSSSFF